MRIGWIGLGNMGLPMAANLAAAGHEVAGFDVVPQALAAAGDRGIRVAGSAAEAATGADVVFTMLPSGGHVDEVLFGSGDVVAVLTADTVLVDSSTIDIATARRLHDTFAERGLRFLDAPVSGGVFGAEAGTLTFMVGGDLAVLEAIRPVIDVLAGRVFHAGGPGNGQAAKLANNLMLAVNTAGLCEGAVLAERLGLEASTFYDIALVSSGESWSLKNWYPMPGVVQTAAVNRDFDGGFAVALMRKDLGLALDSSADVGLDLRTAQLVRGYLDTMIEAGWAGKDTASIVKLVDGSLDGSPSGSLDGSQNPEDTP